MTSSVGIPLLIVHTLLWQVGWFAAVVGAVHGLGWAGPAALVPVLGLHAWVHRRHPGFDLLPLVVAAMLGGAVDAILGHTGMMLMVTGDGAWSTWPPAWMVGLWVALASGLSFGLRWMQGRWLVAVFLGAAGGAAAYLGGERLGALRFPTGQTSGVLTVAAVWAGAMPLLMLVVGRIRLLVMDWKKNREGGSHG